MSRNDMFDSASPWDQIRARSTGDEVLYVLLPDTFVHPVIDFPGMYICRTHLLELQNFKSQRDPRKVRALGVRERVYALVQPECQMCKTHVAHGNVCYNDACQLPLHPQWPAVYCSNWCAIDDL